MTKEYIMQVTVDDDGHEHGLTRKEEVVRCGECKYRLEGRIIDRIALLCNRMETALFTDRNDFCSHGERKR